MKNKLFSLFILLCVFMLPEPAFSQELIATQYLQDEIVNTYRLDDGTIMDQVIILGPPNPTGHEARPVWIPQLPTRGSLIMACVPGYNWCFGCSATSAAMMAAFYDITGRNNFYTGLTNGGVMPMNNSTWADVLINGEWRHQCPLSATRMGLDARVSRGHVDDYWILFGATGPDPWVTNGWVEHTHDDCTGDFMYTNQWVWTGGDPPAPNHNTDGSTTFWFNGDGSPTYFATLRGLGPPYSYDGGAGIEDFFNNEGYTLSDGFNQRIDPYHPSGFTFTQYKAEIDAGRPVIIHVTGHTMLGFGYDDTGNTVYLKDTWDYDDHTMTWGGTYDARLHKSVTVIRPTPVSYTDLTIKNTIVENGKTISFEATNDVYGATSSTSDDLIIDGNGTTGGICTMTAGSNVYLRHGFHAMEGCEFAAQIGTPVPPGNMDPTTETGNEPTNNEPFEEELSTQTPFSLNIYPNPCKGTFIVMIQGELEEVVSLEIYSLYGVLIYNQESFNKKLFLIDINQHKKGVYVLKLIYGEKTFKKKVIYN